MVNENSTRLWINGYIVIGNNTRIPVQEVSIDLSRDLKEHYESGNNKPATIIPGQEKIEFKIKRIFSNTTMMNIYLKRCTFNMILYNTSANPDDGAEGTNVCSLTGCILSKNSLGTLGKGEAVTEDISGKAMDIQFNIKEIAPMLNETCSNL